jgi:serine/threonine protein phosphatase PrpC
MLVDANDAINAKSSEAATTAVVAKLHQVGDTLVASIAHVGDSRAYLAHGDALTPLTIDHTPYRGSDDQESMTQQIRLANTESISTLEGREQWHFKNRNVVGATLGYDKAVTHDITHVTVRPGDKVVLTTDGVHDNLTDREIEKILNDNYVIDHANALTYMSVLRSKDLAHGRRKRDDMTAIVIEI